MNTIPLFPLALSFVFVFSILGLGTLLFRTGKVDGFTSRKIIHIGVSHWWFFFQFFIQDPLWGLLGPVFFLIFNFLARHIGFLKAMEPGKGESNLGTLYFPISLIMMILWSAWGGLPVWQAGAGILVLGWADGLAALVGRYRGKTLLPIPWSKKTWAGSITLVLAATVVLSLFIFMFAPQAWYLILVKALVIGLCLGLMEALTPFGIDNLLLPILTALFLGWIL